MDLNKTQLIWREIFVKKDLIAKSTVEFVRQMCEQ